MVKYEENIQLQCNIILAGIVVGYAVYNFIGWARMQQLEGQPSRCLFTIDMLAEQPLCTYIFIHGGQNALQIHTVILL